MGVNGTYEEVIIAGFGGQGIILLGKLLAQAGMASELEVTYMPSYGAEVRGGTANCMVVLSEDQIAAPLVTRPDTLIAMNKASVDKFAGRIKSGGLLIVNSSMVNEMPQRDDIEIIAVPFDDIALKLNSPKSANMVAIGVYAAKRALVSVETVIESLPEVLAKRYHNMLGVNEQAIQCGAEFEKISSVGY